MVCSLALTSPGPSRAGCACIPVARRPNKATNAVLYFNALTGNGTTTHLMNVIQSSGASMFMIVEGDCRGLAMMRAAISEARPRKADARAYVPMSFTVETQCSGEDLNGMSDGVTTKTLQTMIPGARRKEDV